jgi:hypothetical protein
MRRITVAIAAIIGASIGGLWAMPGHPPALAWYRWLAYATCPFVDLGQSGLAKASIPLCNALAYGLVVHSILRFGRRILVAIFGAGVGVFWVIVLA